jgi:hypothetical protein
VEKAFSRSIEEIIRLHATAVGIIAALLIFTGMRAPSVV